MNALKDIVDSILNNEPVLHWDHREIKNLNDFGIKLIVKMPDFENLKPLRTYINKLVKEIPNTEFIDDVHTL